MPVLPTDKAPAPLQGDVSRLMKLQVPVIVKLAERKLSLSAVMQIGVGAIVEFYKSSEEPLELLINNRPIGMGDAVKVGENFGIKIRQIGDVREIIKSMGR
jgi:flagellar motor switch protein FliN/FliY